MPRPRPRTRRGPSWYTDALKAADAALDGAWWRCPAHGLTVDPLVLGASAYCGDPGCEEPVLLVSKARGAVDEQGRAVW